jgi:hypothetical protein
MKFFYKKRSVKPACSRFLMLPVFCVLLTLAGCGSHKNVVKTVSRKDTQKVEQFLLQNSNFQTMESKVEFKFTARKGVDARMKGSFKMWKDSCVIFSVQPFAGFEAVKCLISKDSIVVVSRLHQVYSVEYLPDSEWKEYLNIATLQSIFCNNIFVPGDAHPDARKLARFESHSQKEGPFYRWAENSFILDFLMTKDNLYYRLKGFRPEKRRQYWSIMGLLRKNPSAFFRTRSIYPQRVFPKTGKCKSFT